LKKVLLLISVFLLLVSCGKEKELIEEMEKLRAENIELRNKIEELENSENDLVVRINQAIEQKNITIGEELLKEFDSKFPLSTNKNVVNDTWNDFIVTYKAEMEQTEKERRELKENFNKSVEELGLVITYDKFENITWIRPSMHPMAPVVLYLGIEGENIAEGNMWTRIVYRNSHDEFTRFGEVIILIDNYTYRKKFEPFSVTRTNNESRYISWRYIEYVDFIPENEDIEMLDELFKVGEGLIRFSGENRNRDLGISSIDVETLKNIMKFKELRDKIN